MKNIVMKMAAVFAALICTLSLAACGGSSDKAQDLTGTTWALSGGSQEGVSVDKETLESLFGGEMTYTFGEDGKLTLALAGVEVEGTWKQDGNTIELDVQGDTGSMKVDGDKLTLEESGVTVEFTKK